MALSADDIVDTALELLDEVGLDALTTRRLAEALNVQGPSLYHHFRNKQDLLGQMAVAMMTRSLGTLERDVPWDDWLRALGRTTRAMILDRRDGARLLTASAPTEAMRHHLIPGIAAPLTRAGFNPASAQHAVALMASFVIGWTMNEQNSTIRGFMGSVMEIEAGFAFGVETIITGLAASRNDPRSER